MHQPVLHQRIIALLVTVRSNGRYHPDNRCTALHFPGELNLCPGYWAAQSDASPALQRGRVWRPDCGGVYSPDRPPARP